jgi:ERCC4-type nuclease
MNDKRIAEILKGITVIVDTREQDLHLTDYFDKFNIPYVQRALKFADYSFECPTIPELGFDEPVSFEQRIVVERKNGLDEISGCLSQSRERFERELQKAKDVKAKFILLIEGGSYEKILKHDYRTNLSEKSFAASLFSFQARYNIEVQFIPSKMAGWFVYNTFYYYLRGELKDLEASL